MSKLATLSQILFGLAVFASPLRWRAMLIERPILPIYGDFTHILLPVSTLAAFLALCLHRISHAPPTQPMRLNSGHTPIIGLGLVMLISSATALDPLLAFAQMAQWLILAGAGLYFMRLPNSPRFLIIALSLFIVSQSLIGIAQVWQQHSLGLQTLGEWELDPQVRGVSVIMLGQSRFLRAYGLADHPNTLAGALALALLVITFSPTKQTRLLQIVVITLGLIALYLTFSRAAWLAWVMGLAAGLGLLMQRRQHEPLRHIAIINGVALATLIPVIIATLPAFTTRLDTSSSLSNAAGQLERAYLNQAAWPILQQHWELGLGMGSIPQALHLAYPKFPLDYQPPHLVSLVIALELGLLGLVIYVTIMLQMLRRAYQQFSGSPANALTHGSIMPIILIVVLISIGLFDYYPWQSGWGRLWHGITWGLCLNLCSKSS